VEEQVLDRMETDLPVGLERQQAIALILEQFPDVRDRRLLELILAGERRTAAYAPLLGIAAEPVEEQKRLVKRAKDRLGKRLERLRIRMTGLTQEKDTVPTRVTKHRSGVGSGSPFPEGERDNAGRSIPREAEHD
ncbi:MAG: hypothetical protein ACR2PL_12830, partial [Dehalococcoidia bacterium]